MRAGFIAWTRPRRASLACADLADRPQHTVLASSSTRCSLGAGAKVWGYHTPHSGPAWSFAALIIPVFIFRHYVQDGGKFPKGALEDLGLKEGDLANARRASGPMWRSRQVPS